MNRLVARVRTWLGDGGGWWAFWTVVCLALGVGTCAAGQWYDYLIGSLLIVEGVAWAFWWGPRKVEVTRQLRESRKHSEEAQARFYWTMGARGVPLDVVRQADELLHDGSVWQANSLLKEWV